MKEKKFKEDKKILIHKRNGTTVKKGIHTKIKWVVNQSEDYNSN